MKLLLDTHAFLWWDSEDPRLPEVLRFQIASPRNEIVVSAVTVWEIAIKRSSGKLTFQGSAARAIEQQGFLSLPITVETLSEPGRFHNCIAIRLTVCLWLRLCSMDWFWLPRTNRLSVIGFRISSDPEPPCN